MKQILEIKNCNWCGAMCGRLTQSKVLQGERGLTKPKGQGWGKVVCHAMQAGVKTPSFDPTPPIVISIPQLPSPIFLCHRETQRMNKELKCITVMLVYICMIQKCILHDRCIS